MNFAKNFLNRLDSQQKLNLRWHYLKFISSIPSFVSYESWIDSYKDLSNILWSMTK